MGRVVVGVLVFTLTGCYSTGGVGYPAEFIDEHRPSRIWVTEANDSVLAFDNPQMHADTLAGYVVGAYREMPMSDVKFVRARTLNAGRTAVLAGALALAAAGAVVSLTGTKGQSNICFNGADQQVPCPTQ
jgi:hypothetical protein